MNRYPELEELAALLYRDYLPYHNFNHALRVLAAGEALLEQCQRENVAINEQVIYYAILLHDAGYHEDERAGGFESKEAYSAHLACRMLEGLGMPEPVISGVKSAILCTHINGHCRSNEDRLVRLADLSGMAADYATFRSDTIDLKQEYEMLNSCTVSWDQWKTQAGKRIEQFMREDMGLTSDHYDADGDPVFRARARNNVETMMSDRTLS